MELVRLVVKVIKSCLFKVSKSIAINLSFSQEIKKDQLFILNFKSLAFRQYHIMLHKRTHILNSTRRGVEHNKLVCKVLTYKKSVMSHIF